MKGIQYSPLKGCREWILKDAGVAARHLRDRQFLFWIVFISLLFDHPADTVETLPDLGEGNIERREPQPAVIGGAKIGDDIHFLDHGAVDAIAFRMADADVRAASGRVTWGAKRKAQGCQQIVG